jgi:hypothetical protein
MSWHCSQALVAEFSEQSCSGGEPSAPSNSTPTADVCSCSDKTTECSQHSRFGMTCERLTELPGGAEWMSSLRASRASRSAKPHTETISLSACGTKPAASSASAALGASCLKTSSVLSPEWLRPPPVSKGSDSSWITAPLLQPPAWVRRILGGDAGYLATPTTMGNQCAVSMMKHKGCVRLRQLFGIVTPDLYEWLMGWPIGWTDLEPLETVRFRQWLDAHGSC